MEISEKERKSWQHFLYRRIDRVQIEGYFAPDDLFEPVASRSALSDERREELLSGIKAWDEAFSHYQAGEFETAKAGLQKLKTIPHFTESIQHLEDRMKHIMGAERSASWTGVWKLGKK